MWFLLYEAFPAFSTKLIIDLLCSQCGSKSIDQETVYQIIQKMQNNYFLGKINTRTSCLRIVSDPISSVFILFWSRKSWSYDYHVTFPALPFPWAHTYFLAFEKIIPPGFHCNWRNRLKRRSNYVLGGNFILM